MIYAILLAAGAGKRMKTKEKKQFMLLNKKPVLEYSIDKFLSIKKIDKSIIVISKNDKDSLNVKKLIKKYEKQIYNGKICLVLGGKERYDSVFSALNFLSIYCKACHNDKVLIHDSARPNFDKNDVENLINLLKKYSSVTLASKLTDTIKEVSSNKVIKTLDRDKYMLISTPQAFDFMLLYNCYKKFFKSKKKYKITDDIQLIEMFSKFHSYVYESKTLNYKITTKNDLDVLKYIMK